MDSALNQTFTGYNFVFQTFVKPPNQTTMQLCLEYMLAINYKFQISNKAKRSAISIWGKSIKELLSYLYK